jgi:hypothetical protein
MKVNNMKIVIQVYQKVQASKIGLEDNIENYVKMKK